MPDRFQARCQNAVRHFMRGLMRRKTVAPFARRDDRRFLRT